MISVPSFDPAIQEEDIYYIKQESLEIHADKVREEAEAMATYWQSEFYYAKERNVQEALSESGEAFIASISFLLEEKKYSAIGRLIEKECINYWRDYYVAVSKK